MNISQIRASLAKSLGNRLEIVNILKEYASSDYVDLLWYDEKEKAFIDKINFKKTPIKFLESDTPSMLGEVYKTKKPYRSTHLHYETLYNVAIDNPFKLDISSQLILPLFLQDKIVGIIRFSKKKYTFPERILQKLLLIENSLVDIFSSEIIERIEQISNNFFSVDINCIYHRLNIIKGETRQLLKETHHPEVIKLIDKLGKDINEIYDYIRFSADKELSKDVSASKLNILIADDVTMNVKILYSMLKKEVDMNFSWAYDGIETLSKIKLAQEENNPINILFLDHHMPGKNGLEIAKLVREAEKLNPNHKMIIVSITNDPNAIKEYKHLFDYHISKPFSKKEISNVMSQIIEQHYCI